MFPYLRVSNARYTDNEQLIHAAVAVLVHFEYSSELAVRLHMHIIWRAEIFCVWIWEIVFGRAPATNLELNFSGIFVAGYSQK
jgi:hypothetical protein